MKLQPGFDKKLRWLYAGCIAAMTVGSAITALRAAIGEPPRFSDDHARTAAMYSLAALAAAVCWRALYRSNLRGSYLMVAASAAFVLAGVVCGYSPRVLWIIGAANAFVLIANLWLGDDSDMDTEQKFFKFRRPW